MAKQKQPQKSILSIQMFPVQKSFLQNHSYLSAIQGPVGSGKSVICIMKLFVYAHCIRPCDDGIRRSRWIIIRNTKKELKDTTMRTFTQWFGNYGTMYETDMNFIMKLGDVEAEFQFIALDTEADTKKLLSLECTGMYFNELRELNQSVWETAPQRIGRFPSSEINGTKSYFDKERAKQFGIIFKNPDQENIDMKCIFADTNPPTIGSYFYNLFEKKLFDEETGRDNNPPDFKLYKQPSGMSEFAENKKFLPDNYYEDLVANSTQEKIDVMVHAMYGLGESGLGVYRSYFDRKLHVQPATFSRYIPNTKLVIGMDFGLNPACVIGQFIDGIYYVYENLYTLNNNKKGLTQFLQDDVIPALRKYHYHKLDKQSILVLGDPAGNQRNQLTGQNLLQELQKTGFYLRMDNWDNSISNRLEAVKTMLRNPRDKNSVNLICDDKCNFLIDGLSGSYYYDKDKLGFKDTPMKNEYSHTQDALQYACKHLRKFGNRFLDNSGTKIYYKNNTPVDSITGY